MFLLWSKSRCFSLPRKIDHSFFTRLWAVGQQSQTTVEWKWSLWKLRCHRQEACFSALSLSNSAKRGQRKKGSTSVVLWTSPLRKKSSPANKKSYIKESKGKIWEKIIWSHPDATAASFVLPPPSHHDKRILFLNTPPPYFGFIPVKPHKISLTEKRWGRARGGWLSWGEGGQKTDAMCFTGLNRHRCLDWWMMATF